MHPSGRPLDFLSVFIVISGPPSVVHGPMYLGSPVDANPLGAGPGVAGQKYASDLSNAAKKGIVDNNDPGIDCII